MIVNKMRNNMFMVVIIAVAILAEAKWGVAETTILTADKKKSIALNLLYLLAPGGGLGLEVDTKIRDKFCNLSFPIRVSWWAVPHGEHKEDEGYDYPFLMRIGFGIRYFPGMQLHRGFFLSDNITFTHGQFNDPESSTKGTFLSIGTVHEIGYRWIYGERFFLQASFGLGWLFSGKVNISNEDETTLGLPKVTGLNADGGLIIGWAF